MASRSKESRGKETDGFLRSLFPLVAMVQPADSGQLNHLTAMGRFGLDWTLIRSVLAEAIVGSVVVVIVNLGQKDSL